MAFLVRVELKTVLGSFNKGDAAQSAVCKVGGLGPPKLNNEESLWPKAITD